MKRVVAAGLVTLTLAIVLTISFEHSENLSTQDSVKKPGEDVIVISVNLLRPDHMPCYSYERNTTPNICSVAKDGVLFEQAVSPATWSLPAYGSLFTSQYPGVHGLRRDQDRLSEETVLLSERLNKAGYSTGAFVGSIRGGSGELRPKYGFDRGFDTYSAQGHLFGDTIPSAKKWILANRNRSSFLFLHGQDLHYPWEYPGKYDHMYDEDYNGVLNSSNFSLHVDYSDKSKVLDDIYRINGKMYLFRNKTRRISIKQRDMEHIRAHYDGGAHYTDYRIGKFISWLKENEMYQNTTIIITGDHGTSIGDRKLMERNRIIGHGVMPFEEQIRIPLIIKPSSNLPEYSNNRISSQVGLIDVMPTILDFHGGNISDRMQGKSLEKLMWGKDTWKEQRHMFSQTARRTAPAVRTENWKLIDATSILGKYLLYNISSTAEQRNLYDKRNGVTQELQSRLESQRLRNIRLREN